MKKHIYTLSLLALLASGCSQDEALVKNQSHATGKTFTASFEQNDSRTYIEEGNLLRWTAGDQISLFEGYTLNSKYQFDGETGDNGGTFTKVSNPFGTGNKLDCHYAVYPYTSDAKITEKGVITITLPAEQSYAENSFGLGDNTMVAVTKDTDDTFLSFKNVGGYLKLQLYGNDITVKSITLTGNNDEKIAGKASITATYDKEPTITMLDEATQTITLDCREGVKLGNSAEKATSFWIVVPPTTFEEGLTITVTDINGDEFTKSTSNQIVIERNTIKPMAAIEVKPETAVDDGIPYLTFSAEEEQSLTMSKAVETLEYSVDGGEWKELGTNIVTFGGNFGRLRLRGKNLRGTTSSTSYSDISRIMFANNATVTCTGDIRTLLDFENIETVNTANARFRRLFMDCTVLEKAPELPIMTITEYCYEGMFNGCTSLTQAPKLPAMTLADHCYAEMFKGCINLNQAPELPAQTLASSCYANMFANCTNLKKAPKLEATTLAESCYLAMFADCTNLTEAPTLPAMVLTEGCYSGMFGRTGLVKAPALPATTLAANCYHGMFNACRKLKEASKLPATTLATNCYSHMFSLCSSLTNAPELPATTLAIRCYDAMFMSCTSLTKTPNLPATTLTNYCYYKMFSGCTNLTEAQNLPATTLAKYCYANMFDGCSNLVVAPELPALNLVESCYTQMFINCSNLTKAPKLPATTLAKLCYSLMFYGCSSLEKAPCLPATKLVQACYAQMFYQCSHLNSITMLATNLNEDECLDYWVDGVSATGTFIKAKEMDSLPNGVSGIPSEWTIKNYGE